MKKRAISLLLAFAMLASVLPMSVLPASAYNYTDIVYPVEGGNIYFDKETGTITDCDESVTKAVIPAEIDGAAVTNIRYHAFAYCDSLTSVTIPDSVTIIGSLAFDTCINLTDITIGSGVTFIDSNAFMWCDNLTNVYISDLAAWCSITFHANPLYAAENLYINGVLATDITIPRSVTAISDTAFSGCSSLTKVTIPDSVTNIGICAFADCSELTGIWVDGGNEQYSSDKSGVLFNKDKTTLIQCPGGYSGSYVIPNSVINIGEASFDGCKNLTGLTIPGSVTNIGSSAFDDCTGLTGVYISDLAAWCNITFRDNPFYMAENLYINGTLATDVTIPAGVTNVSNGAFTACTSLTKVTLPDSVTNIDWDAFCDCTSLISVTIGNGVTSIGDAAFRGCTSLTSVTMGNALTDIKNFAFSDCTALSSVTIPASVTGIGWSAFGDCDSLTSVYFMGDAPSLGYNVFDIYNYNGGKDEFKPIPGLTLYYIEGKEGWTSPAWNGYPTATWTPDETEDPPQPDQPETTPVEFSDVSANAWYAEAVDYAVTNGLMNGTGNNKFEPESAMTRAMLVTVLWRYAGEPLEGKNGFTDVPNGQWYTEAVAWAAENGIVGGVGNGRFDPDGNITREQLAAILYRYCNSVGIDTSARADLTSFPDGGKVSGYAQEPLAWAVSAGLVTGSKVGDKVYLDPQGNATRAQVATILMRFIENIAK